MTGLEIDSLIVALMFTSLWIVGREGEEKKDNDHDDA